MAAFLPTTRSKAMFWQIFWHCIIFLMWICTSHNIRIYVYRYEILVFDKFNSTSSLFPATTPKTILRDGSLSWNDQILSATGVWSHTTISKWIRLFQQQSQAPAWTNHGSYGRIPGAYSTSGKERLRHSMITSCHGKLSALLTLFQEIPSLAVGFPSQKASNAEIWRFSGC